MKTPAVEKDMKWICKFEVILDLLDLSLKI
jgi:hypothetical protein